MSNHWHVYSLFNSLFKLTANKTKRSALLTICKENSVVNAGFPLHRASNPEHNFRAMSSWSDYILHRQRRISVIPEGLSKRIAQNKQFLFLIAKQPFRVNQQFFNFMHHPFRFVLQPPKLAYEYAITPPVVYMDVINNPRLKSNVGLSNPCLEEKPLFNVKDYLLYRGLEV